MHIFVCMKTKSKRKRKKEQKKEETFENVLHTLVRNDSFHFWYLNYENNYQSNSQPTELFLCTFTTSTTTCCLFPSLLNIQSAPILLNLLFNLTIQHDNFFYFQNLTRQILVFFFMFRAKINKIKSLSPSQLLASIN